MPVFTGQGQAHRVKCWHSEGLAEEPDWFRIATERSDEAARAVRRSQVGPASRFAIAVGRELGLDPAQIAQKIAGYQPLSMRWEKTECRGVTFINDAYNANPVSMRAAMNGFMETECAGKRWIVLGGMWELGDTEVELHGVVGKFATELSADHVLFVGAFAEMLGASGGQCLADPRAAAELLRAQAQPGDIILLKASRGEHLEQIIEFFEGD